MNITTLNKRHSTQFQWGMKAQSGFILVLSLVLLLVLTITTGAMVRSALVGVNTTAALQRNMIVHHGLNSQLIVYIDYLQGLKRTNYNQYINIIESAIANGSATVTLPANVERLDLAAFRANTKVDLRDINVSLIARKHVPLGVAGLPNELPLSREFPKINKNLCQGDGSISENNACFNMLLVAIADVGNSRGGAYQLTQYVGFGQKEVN